MKVEYFRELRKYTPGEIEQKLQINDEEVKKLLRELIINNVVNKVKENSDTDETEDEESNQVEEAEEANETSDKKYVFTYVGIIVLGEYTFICYPKYISSTEKPLDEMKQVLKVLDKYKKQEQEIDFANRQEESEKFEVLGNILFLLNDYMEHNIYTNQLEVIELNGQGEINWDITINETYPFILKNGRPYYLDLYTHHSIDDDRDYFQRLHMCILTKCSDQLEESQLNQLFDFERIKLYDGDLEEFGEIEYILYRLNNELAVQFNSRKQTLLRAMYRYLSEQYKARDDFQFTSYGTSHFYSIWENVCASVFNNQLNTKLKDLPITLSKDYESRKNKSLIELIKKPIWKAIKEGEVIRSEKGKGTLKPDLISFYKYKDQWCFGIFDAKYYDIQFNKAKFYNRPGIQDITKQYLYQLAYQDYILKHDFVYIENAFLVPSEQDKFEVFGEVEMQMLHELTDTKLKIYPLLNPQQVYYMIYI